MTDTKKLKRNIINVTKFQMSIIIIQLIMFLLTLTLNFFIGLIVGSVSKNPNATGGSLDIVAIIYGLILGVLFFAASFKFSLVNGVSRRAIFISCILTLLISTTALAVLTGIFMSIANAGNTTNLYFIMYGKNYGGLFSYLFSAMLTMEIIGWFSTVFAYRTNKKTKLIVLGVFILIIPFFLLFNLINNGALGRGLTNFLKIIIGLNGTAPNPYIMIITLLTISILLLGGIYLMLRKAVIKS